MLFIMWAVIDTIDNLFNDTQPNNNYSPIPTTTTENNKNIKNKWQSFNFLRLELFDFFRPDPLWIHGNDLDRLSMVGLLWLVGWWLGCHSVC